MKYSRGFSAPSEPYHSKNFCMRVYIITCYILKSVTIPIGIVSFLFFFQNYKVKSYHLAALNVPPVDALCN